MHIFITNDDGWGAKGILTLVKIMRKLGDVTVVAPDGPRSAQSNAITVLTPLRLNKIIEEPGLTVYTSNGTPTDCVKLGIHILFPDKRPDLICSGINHGDNGCVNVMYSGTMGAVFEGCEHGILSIGWSICDHNPDADFSHFEPEILRLTQFIIEQPKREFVCWNINAPQGPLKGCRLTRHCHGYWDKEYMTYTDPSGKPFYMITGQFVSTDKSDNLEDYAVNEIPTDRAANKAGYISVSPTSIDMTEHRYFASPDAGINYELD
ncbi:MAG: 5'/3'-nucleotidase SurE [Paludibacteraceae bacterium]|nr:5'/3'-nucleotidase SurE [Paludibacteraceae bacterium]